MLDKMATAWVWVGALLLGVGCASIEKGTSGDSDNTTGPEPGTRAFYELKIRNVYVLDAGELVRIATNAYSTRYPTIRASGPSGVIRTKSGLPSAQAIEGRTLQVLETNLVVVGKALTNVSGAVTYPRSFIVSVAGNRPLPEAGSWFRVLAMSTGNYTYQDSSGSGSLPAYREVTQPTYEEYRQIYDRDCQAAVVDPLVSVTRVTNTAVQAIEPAQSTAAVPPVAVPPVAAASPQRPSARRYALLRRAQSSTLILGDYTYSTNAAGQATITGFNKNYSGTLAVTNDLGGYPVTSIKDEAFKNCTNLTSITIPASVTGISGTAFSGCSGLASILVDVLNPAYSSSADGVLFNTEKTRLVCYPQGKAGSYAIPSRVTRIGGGAFRDCAGLTGVTIPNGVVVIEGGAFAGCSSLTTLTIPASAVELDAWAFAGSSRVNAIRVDEANPAYSSSADGVVFNKEKNRLIRFPSGRSGVYAIPETVTSIGPGAFNSCAGLTGITIPASVTRIEWAAFERCASLTGMTVPDSVTNMAGGAFSDCAGMTNVTIGNGVTDIGGCAFHNCSNLTTVILGNSVTNIGGWAFWDCTRLIDVTIPASVSGIGFCAFMGCHSLAGVTIPERVASIEGHSFRACFSITNVTIPDNVTSIADNAFDGCRALTTAKIGSSVTNIGLYAFGGCTNLGSVYFEGHAPSLKGGASGGAFAGSKATLYYLPGKTGWENEFAGRPTALRDAQGVGK